MGDLDQNLKIAFSKVKEDINNLAEEIKSMKQTISDQNKKINELYSKIEDFMTISKDPKTESSIGNEGVNQSINHLINQSINQSITNQSLINEKPSKSIEKEEFKPDLSTIDFNQSINQSSINQSFNQSINQKTELKQLAININQSFLSLSKQELKLFLTIYQLEDDGIEPLYHILSQKMQLSEHCIRSHISSLMRKNIPIIKTRLNNRINLISIRKDFKALNLKQKLISIYYNVDPHQKTLFDIN
jgi:hypothetical protein